MIAGLQVAAIEAIIEFAKGRRLKAFLGIQIDALGVAGHRRVKKTQEEIGIDVVMVGDGTAVRAQLAEQQGLQKAPGVGQRMQVLHLLPQEKGLQKVSFDVDVAGDIGIPDPAFVYARQCAQAAPVVDGNGEGRRAVAEKLTLAVRKGDLEGNG